MDVDEDECCEQAFDEGEVERMDRELDDLDTDDVSHLTYHYTWSCPNVWIGRG